MDKRTSEDIYTEIMNWDKRDVSTIKNLTELPYADLEALGVVEYTLYPIWTCDENGMCLVGAAADQIEFAENIRRYYEEE